eukprot:Tamp_24737.p4 GENE.Tamp_24737~~Tamp_24737.p4  ORF type:complete len:114 (+),score=41.08 Tamp_24737:107-448(+)
MDVGDEMILIKVALGTHEERERKPQVNGEGGDQKIQIKVKLGGNAHLDFIIKKKTKMARVMDAFARKQGLERYTLRFLFDGSRINEDDTALSLELEDDDMIDAFLHQVGGADV